MNSIELLYARRFAEVYGYELEKRDGVIKLLRSGVEYESFNSLDEFYDYITELTND